MIRLLLPLLAGFGIDCLWATRTACRTRSC